MNYPNYRILSDDDVMAIVAFLRTRKPVRRDGGVTALGFPVGMMITVPQPLESSPAGLPAAGVERGRAMIKVMLCGECHTPRDGQQSRARRDLVAASSRALRRRLLVEHHVASVRRHRRLQQRRSQRVFREEESRRTGAGVMPWSVTKNMSDADLAALIATRSASSPRPPIWCRPRS